MAHTEPEESGYWLQPDSADEASTDAEATPPAPPRASSPTEICRRCGLWNAALHDTLCGRCRHFVGAYETEDEKDRYYEDEDEYEDEDDDWYPDKDNFPPPSRSRSDADDENWTGPLHGVLLVYGLILLVSLVWGARMQSRAEGFNQEQLLHEIAVMEGVDTAIALIGLVCVGRAAIPRSRRLTRQIAYVTALPVLSILILLNLLYFAVLRESLGVAESEATMPLSWFTVLLVCVQPAIVEELFFRFVMFGAIHRSVGLHSTVWITAAMFAVAHIYNPLGLPYLFLVGGVLGYARLTGGLGLAIILHFLHNLAVLAISSTT